MSGCPLCGGAFTHLVGACPYATTFSAHVEAADTTLGPIVAQLRAQLATVTKERDEALGRVADAGTEAHLYLGAQVERLQREVATARSEGWRAGVRAAAKVAREWLGAGKRYERRGSMTDNIADAIEAMPEISLTETKGKEP